MYYKGTKGERSVQFNKVRARGAAHRINASGTSSPLHPFAPLGPHPHRPLPLHPLPPPSTHPPQEVASMQFNVLLTTYEMVMRDAVRLNKLEWRYIVIDEAQRMKDSKSKLSRDLMKFKVCVCVCV